MLGCKYFSALAGARGNSPSANIRPRAFATRISHGHVCYTVSGGESHRSKGGFSATGDEALALWAYFCAMATDVMGGDDAVRHHPRVKVG